MILRKNYLRTMINFYNNDQLAKMKKRYKITLLVFSFAILLFALATTLFIVFANYDNKSLIIVLGVFLLTLILWIIIYLLFSLSNQNKQIYLYNQILNGDITKLNGEIVYVASNPITLQNSMKVYEIRLKVKDTIFNLVLLESLDITLFKQGSKAELDVVSEYIRGVNLDEK